jgi:hypothetical protein
MFLVDICKILVEILNKLKTDETEVLLTKNMKLMNLVFEKYKKIKNQYML